MNPVTSSGWIEHFYVNACLAKGNAIPSDLTMEDLRSLLAVRPGQLTKRSGRLLIEHAQAAADQSGDGAFFWAVRLYVREQERQGTLFDRMASLHGKSLESRWFSRISAPILDTLPIEAVLSLLACRARVAARFFLTLATRSGSPQMRVLAQRMAAEHTGQLQFIAFALSRLTADSVLPSALVRPAKRAVTLAIATRVWVRQRRRLREAGETFGGFVTAMLDQAALP